MTFCRAARGSVLSHGRVAGVGGSKLGRRARSAASASSCVCRAVLAVLADSRISLAKNCHQQHGATSRTPSASQRRLPIWCAHVLLGSPHSF